MKQKHIVRLLMASLSASFMMACSESYPGITYDETQGKEAIENKDSWTEKTPIKVFVNEQDIFIVRASSTRGTGAFESADTANVNRLNHSTFYALAFRDGRYTQSGIDDLKNPTDFRWWSHKDSNGPRSFSDYMVNNNCLLDGPDYNYGLPMYLIPEGAGMLHTARDVTEEVDEYYYSPVNQQVPYNFFAYYLDDNQPTKVNRTEESFSYDIEIDGSQDLMCGAAPNLIDEIRNGNLGNKWNFLSADEKRTIENIGGYCTFTANRGIHPEVKMKHLLTRMTFELYPADESASDITITEVKVESRCKGTMTVAARTIDEIGVVFSNERKQLPLRDPSDGQSPCPPLTPQSVEYEESMKGYEWYDRPKKDIGSSLMVAPDSIYNLYLTGIQKKRSSLTDPDKYEPVTFTARYTLTPPKTDLSKKDDGYWFAPGVNYPVKIAVYGLQQIKVYASVEGWIPSDEAIYLEDYTE